MSVVIRFLFLFSIVTLTLPLSGCVVTLTKLAVAPVKSRIEERKLPKEKPQSFEFTLDELKKRLAAKPDVDAFIGDKHKVIEENKHDLIKHLTFIPKWLRKLAMQKHYIVLADSESADSTQQRLIDMMAEASREVNDHFNVTLPPAPLLFYYVPSNHFGGETTSLTVSYAFADYFMIHVNNLNEYSAEEIKMFMIYAAVNRLLEYAEMGFLPNTQHLSYYHYFTHGKEACNYTTFLKWRLQLIKYLRHINADSMPEKFRNRCGDSMYQYFIDYKPYKHRMYKFLNKITTMLGYGDPEISLLYKQQNFFGHYFGNRDEMIYRSYKIIEKNRDNVSPYIYPDEDPRLTLPGIAARKKESPSSWVDKARKNIAHILEADARLTPVAKGKKATLYEQSIHRIAEDVNNALNERFNAGLPPVDIIAYDVSPEPNDFSLLNYWDIVYDPHIDAIIIPDVLPRHYEMFADPTLLEGIIAQRMAMRFMHYSGAFEEKFLEAANYWYNAGKASCPEAMSRETWDNELAALDLRKRESFDIANTKRRTELLKSDNAWRYISSSLYDRIYVPLASPASYSHYAIPTPFLSQPSGSYAPYLFEAYNTPPVDAWGYFSHSEYELRGKSPIPKDDCQIDRYRAWLEGYVIKKLHRDRSDLAAVEIGYGDQLSKAIFTYGAYNTPEFDDAYERIHHIHSHMLQ